MTTKLSRFSRRNFQISLLYKLNILTNFSVGSSISVRSVTANESVKSHNYTLVGPGHLPEFPDIMSLSVIRQTHKINDTFKMQSRFVVIITRVHDAACI